MGRPAFSTDQIREIQLEIRATALEIFKAEGIRGLTLRSIAKRMGRTPAALYRYYASKDELLEVLCIDGFRAMGERLRRARELAPDAQTAAREGMRAYLDFALSEPEQFSLMYSLDQRDLPTRPAVQKQRQESFGEARAIAAEAIEAGWLDGDPNVAAHLLWVGCHGLASLVIADQLDLGCGYDDLIDPLLNRIVGA